MAVNEPALSFEFDSSQSLFEQLTKAQQANSSSFAAHAAPVTYSQSTSPVMRAVDSMPPPQMMPQTMPVVPEEQNQHMYGATTMSMAPGAMHPAMVKREPEYTIQYDRNGIPLARVHQRHTSMPAYMEYSPAPSFVSSHFEDYSNRGISFEPVTPPQHGISLGPEPAYIANEDTGLYTAIPDLGPSATFNPMMQLPPSNLAGPGFSAATRTFPQSNVYSVIEGSPTYKQRRRRSSIPSSITNAIAAAQAANGTARPHAAHRPSELRRSISSSVAPVAEGDESGHDSPPGLTNSYPSTVSHQRDLLQEISRHGTPLPSLEESPNQKPTAFPNMQDDLSALTNTDLSEHSVHNSPAVRAIERSTGGAPGPMRRARSATMMELGPYPHKSHSCPIPTCGRLFKRLEHLKR